MNKNSAIYKGIMTLSLVIGVGGFVACGSTTTLIAPDGSRHTLNKGHEENVGNNDGLEINGKTVKQAQAIPPAEGTPADAQPPAPAMEPQIEP